MHSLEIIKKKNQEWEKVSRKEKIIELVVADLSTANANALP